jgi:plastocyanin
MTESRSLHRWSGVGLAARAATALLTGCGGSAAHVAAGATIRIAVREYHLTPATIDAQPGTLTFSVFNDGRLPHDLVITSAAGTRAAKTPGIAPDTSATVQATLSAGTYALDSSLGADKTLGIVGTLHVG